MIKHVSLTLITLYQRLISPLFPSVCRFYPSCSEYTKISIQNEGVFKGSLLGMKRLCKCHPFHAGGIDLPGRCH